MKHLDYTVIIDDTLPGLMEQVQAIIGKGWICIGGIALEQDIKDNRSPRIKTKYYQAMVLPG